MWRFIWSIRTLINILSSFGVIKFGLKEGHSRWLTILEEMGPLEKPGEGAPAEMWVTYKAQKKLRIDKWFGFLRPLLLAKFGGHKNTSAILNFIYAIVSMRAKAYGP